MPVKEGERPVTLSACPGVVSLVVQSSLNMIVTPPKANTASAMTPPLRATAMGTGEGRIMTPLTRAPLLVGVVAKANVEPMSPTTRIKP